MSEPAYPYFPILYQVFLRPLGGFGASTPKLYQVLFSKYSYPDDLIGRSHMKKRKEDYLI